MSTLLLRVPNLGESINEAVIGKWKRAEGDQIALDEPLVEVESDKATVDVPAPAAGVLRRILRRAGETVPVGGDIAEIDVGAGASAGPMVPAPRAPTPAAPPPSLAAPVPPLPVAVAAPPATNGHTPPALADARAPGNPKASPSTRRMMHELGIEPAEVIGSGPAGRIERADVDRAAGRSASAAPASTSPPTSLPTSAVVQASPAPQPSPSPVAPSPAPAARPLGKPDPFGRPERVVPMTPLRKTVARRLLQAQHEGAILTTFNEINMAEVMALRERYQEAFQKRHGIKLGFMSFFVKAAVDALKAFPVVNAEVRGDAIVYKDFFDVGVAVGGGKGLVVPVVRNADRLTLAEVERTIAELAVRARENKLQLHELEGGTFTISNGGVYGSMLSTPIINPPQSGILGLHAIQRRPVAVGEAIALRPMMYVALSYDHRIIDGREAVQFLVRIKDCIENPERLLIEV
jgi:2-oxoglutarate dehydrogenase E2 component (dihydrolipoamide succinyltransferase)